MKIITGDLQLANEAGDLDQTHRIGHKHDGGKSQGIIVCMESQSSRHNERNANKNRSIKIVHSITNKRRTLLATAKHKFEGHPAINFLFIDINGDLKILLNEPIKNRYAFNVEDVEDIENLFMALTNETPDISV